MALLLLDCLRAYGRQRSAAAIPETNETAELLQVSKRTLQRMINRKDLPAFKVGSQWRIYETALAKWLQRLHER